MHSVLIINGPNLNMLGKREEDIYGENTLIDLEEYLKKGFHKKANLRFFQSNHEGAMIDEIQNSHQWAQGIIINPGGYTHSSVAIRDAIAAIAIPTIEVHLSNIYNREEFRHKSLIAPVCMGQISGFKMHSYTLGVQAMLFLLNKRLPN